MGYSACHINGRSTHFVAPDNRGLAYGDGVFETILIRQGKPLWLDDHLQRLQEGADSLAISLNIKILLAEINAFLALPALDGDTVLKILLCRGSGGRGYFPQDSESLRILLGSPAPISAMEWERGVKLALCKTRLAAQPALAGIKHLNRLEQVLASGELLRRGFSEGLMMDQGGAIIEACRSNVFLVKSGVLMTPNLDRCGIKGIMRKQVLAFARSADLAFRETRVTMADFLSAEEGFICNSVFGIWPISSLECIAKAVGPVTRRMQAEFGVAFGG